MSEVIKALVVDDSVVYRRIITTILNELEGVEVLGSAPNGKIALAKIDRLKPDLVTLDMDMPIMDGLETLKNIAADYPGTAAVMVSANEMHSANQTLEALACGALDFIVKPVNVDYDASMRELGDQLSNIIKVLGKGHGTRAYRKNKSITQAPALSVSANKPLSTSQPSFVQLLLIGSSTGGPKALDEFIPLIPKDFFVPVLLVQHMPPLFTASLARKLNEDSELDVCEATDGLTLEPGKVFIAPGHKHMTLAKDDHNNYVVRLLDTPPVNSCKPSVDTLFESVAKTFNAKRTLCVILTGMGADGVNGVRALRDLGGGYCLSQSESSSVVYGMPRSIVEAGLDSEVLDLKDMAKRVIEICMP